jgi:hypothetical protein
MLLTAGIGVAMASPTAYSITISTADKLGPYYGYTLVFYRATGGYQTATVSGKVTGAVAGDVAELLAKPFHATSYVPTGMSITLSPQGSAPVSYTFKVNPSLATSYEVQVLTSGTVDVTSSARTVYVATGGYSKSFRIRCSSGHCTGIWKIVTQIPASAYKTEAAKKNYFYFALARHTPRYLYLYKNVTVSKPHKISSGSYEQTFTFHFNSRLKNPTREVSAEICTKDAEAKDGMGLPRPTGCGGKRILNGVYAG